MNHRRRRSSSWIRYARCKIHAVASIAQSGEQRRLDVANNAENSECSRWKRREFINMRGKYFVSDSWCTMSWKKLSESTRKGLPLEFLMRACISWATQCSTISQGFTGKQSYFDGRFLLRCSTVGLENLSETMFASQVNLISFHFKAALVKLL